MQLSFLGPLFASSVYSRDVPAVGAKLFPNASLVGLHELPCQSLIDGYLCSYSHGRRQILPLQVCVRP